MTQLFLSTMLLSTVMERLSRPTTIIGLALALCAVVVMVFSKPLAEKLKPQDDNQRLNAVLRFKIVAMVLAFSGAALVIFFGQ